MTALNAEAVEYADSISAVFPLHLTRPTVDRGGDL